MNAKELASSAAVAAVLLRSTQAAAGNDRVSISFTGTLPAKCELSNSNTVLDLGLLGSKGTKSVAFTLSCNASFHFALTSQSGGLAQRVSRARPPFVSLIPYAVSLNLGQTRISDPGGCQSASMTGTRPSCAGNADANIAYPAAQNASLSVSWDPLGTIPLAGSYSDTLVLRVGPDY